MKIDQPSAKPTRKVTAATIGAGTIGAAAGGALGDLAAEAATLSPWLTWLAHSDVQMLVTSLGIMAGTFVAGYFVRDTAVSPAGMP